MKDKMRNLLARKHKGLDGIVIATGLILIAMIVVVIFKDELQPVMNTSIGSVADSITSVTSELSVGSN